MEVVPAFSDEQRWAEWQDQWALRTGTIYLNHGSFGPSPRCVVAARRHWQQRLESQPMDFFVRQFEPAWLDARAELARFVNTTAENLVFVENATTAMNLVADNFKLRPGDRVVLTNHEYGAVVRTWQRACRRAQTGPPLIARLPAKIESVEQVVDSIFSAVDQRCRLLVVSHITSPTAIVLPVQEICQRARSLGIAVCVDGPHAPAQVPLDFSTLDCDFYTASCHKWLCAPFGSGFLMVKPHYQAQFEPAVLSWGRLPPAAPAEWWEEHVWCGTRDPSSYLAIPAALRFMQEVGLDTFRSRTHALAQYARHRLQELTGRAPPTPDSPKWYGSMALGHLPPCDGRRLQQSLWDEFGIEVPIIEFEGQWYARVSCHLYNTPAHIDRLIEALEAKS